MKVTFTLHKLRSMARPTTYLDELRAVAVTATDDAMTFDTESAPYKAIVEKYRNYQPTADERQRQLTYLGTSKKAARQSDATPPSKFTANAVVDGVIGVAKAVIGAGGASEEQIKERAAICNVCPNATLTAGMLKRCNKCGCALWAKIRNAAAKCPEGRWVGAAGPTPIARTTVGSS